MPGKGGVPIGWTSVGGWAVTALGLIPLFVKAIESGQVAFHSDEKWLAVFGVIGFSLTQVFRYLQALKAPPPPPAPPEPTAKAPSKR